MVQSVIMLDRTTPQTAPIRSGFPSAWLSISLVDVPSCDSGFKVNKATCKNMFTIALDGCNTGATDKKYGGSTKYECGIYDIQLKPGHDDTSPRGFAAEHGG